MIASRPRRSSGFTLLEIMIVTAIIGMLLSMAIPTFKTVRRSTQNTTYANDVRTIAGLMEQYATEYGVWPSTSAAGAVPTGLEDSINDRIWTQRNSLGGQFFLLRNEGNVVAGIASEGHNADLQQILSIDEKMDDGSLIAGIIRLDGTRLIYVLQSN